MNIATATSVTFLDTRRSTRTTSGSRVTAIKTARYKTRRRGQRRIKSAMSAMSAIILRTVRTVISIGIKPTDHEVGPFLKPGTTHVDDRVEWPQIMKK